MKHFNKLIATLLALTIAIALFMFTACAPAQSVALAATPEPTPTATATPTPTPSPTLEPTPSPTPTPQPTPVLSREEELAFLGMYNLEQSYVTGHYVFIYCVLQNGEKVVIPVNMTSSSTESTDFRYVFGDQIMVTFYPNLLENHIPAHLILEKTTHIYSISNLDGAVIQMISPLYEFPKYCSKFGVDIIESEEYLELMDYITKDGVMGSVDKKVKLGDFANVYVSCLEKENRINAAFVNATVRTRGMLAPGQTPYTTPAPTPTPTIAGAF